MRTGYIWTLQRICLLLGSIILLAAQSVNSLESSLNDKNPVSHIALDDESREKRHAEIDIPSEEENLQVGKRSKRYIPYEELQKRLRHFIGKRKDDDDTLSGTGPDAIKRMRYFVGKRGDEGQTNDEDEDVEKRMRYFVGKRSRLRYFLGKRDGDDAEPLSDFEKRMRYFVGKRRYFIGKRDNSDQNEESVAKRMRYFVGKRAGYDLINDLPKRMRYFVGKRDPIEDQIDGLAEKRMRYFVGKRDLNTLSEDTVAQNDKRGMRYFVG